MHPTLFHIPTHLSNGTPVFGFGLLLAVWAVFCAGFFGWLVWRQGLNADTWSYAPIFLLVAAVIVWLLPAIGKEGGLPIRSYGVMVLTAVLGGAALAGYRARRAGVSPDAIYAAIFWMVILGILGARIFYVAEYWRRDYWPICLRDGWMPFLWALANISEGGLVVYGSFFGGMAGLLWFVRRHRLPLLPILDLLAPSMVLGAALGRIGCLLNGCCFGGVCDRGPAIEFPRTSPAYENQIERGLFHGFSISGNENVSPVVVNSVESGSLAEKAGLRKGDRIVAIDGEKIRAAGDVHKLLAERFLDREPVEIETAERGKASLPALSPPPRSRPVHPTQLYSAIDALLICFLLLAYDPFRRRNGELFALMATIYPVTRFLIEFLRSDEAAIRGTGMSISQNVSLLILLGAACFWYYLSRRPKGFAFAKNA
ncbi:MAG: prolipoprotein diacylglyceryl transferase [Pirellulales bacterium]|nr:prolipoprotein diacylglyceryl transferase [Pirellulales bacterium]